MELVPYYPVSPENYDYHDPFLNIETFSPVPCLICKKCTDILTVVFQRYMQNQNASCAHCHALFVRYHVSAPHQIHRIYQSQLINFRGGNFYKEILKAHAAALSKFVEKCIEMAPPSFKRRQALKLGGLHSIVDNIELAARAARAKGVNDPDYYGKLALQRQEVINEIYIACRTPRRRHSVS